MARLVRLVYASKATFETTSDGAAMEPEVAQILEEARVNNARDKISGALYFSDGYFFQCLEGKEKPVLELVEKLETDPRHKGLKVSYFKTIHRRRFKNWSMRYVPVLDEVKALIKSRGYDSFRPTEFDESDINAIINMFSTVKDQAKPNQSTPLTVWWRRLFRRHNTEH